MHDMRLHKLTAALAPRGVVGVSVPDWANKLTWGVWYEGGSRVVASTDPNVSDLVTAFDTTLPPEDPLDHWDVVTLKIAFKHENDIRPLKGQSVITMAQFKNAVRAL